MFDRDEIAAWVRLLETPGVGRESVRRLLAAFGSPQAVLAAPTGAHREVAGVRVAQALATMPGTLDAMVQATLTWLGAAADEARDIVTLGDPRYPATLLNSADPPLLLYTQGNCEWLSADSLAVVGSRNPSRQGLDNARAFATELSRAGVTVVSGLALGIDGAAHEGALEGPGSTIAVVGTGLDQIYPRRHRELARRIVKQGLIVSEYSLGTPPLPVNFPMRNRIIAGLSRGTLVVEAALQSGSLITARLALESGRDVYAIPGSIHSAQSRGSHALIKQGAKLVDTAQDVLEDMGRPSPATSVSKQPVQRSLPAEAPADPLLDALGYDPMGLDALVARTGWSAADLNVRLLELELSGRVARLPGQLFQRIAHG